MLVTKSVVVKWNTRNKNWFIEKGYTYTKIGNTFECLVQDLNRGAKNEIDVTCDYCTETSKRVYVNYYKAINTETFSHINKDCCQNCEHIRREEMIEYKQKNGLLTRNDCGYWMYKENRQKELKTFIEKYGHANVSGHPKGNSIFLSFRNNYDEFVDVIEKLGYDVRKVLNRVPQGYYDDFDRVKKVLEEFIELKNRFPTMQEIIYDLGLSQSHIDKHGGLYEVKRKMNYFNDCDLVDDNNFLNRSYYEYIVAQYLINIAKITYKREQTPFPSDERDFRSDFTFYPKNGKEIHVEVWGFDNRISKINNAYNITKSEKIKLYEKYNIKMISIEQEAFSCKTYDEIINNLNIIFKTYICNEFLHVDCNTSIYFPKYSDQELFEYVMKFSIDGSTLPTIEELRKNNGNAIYTEIIKRFKTYYNFSVNFNVKAFRKNYWTYETVLEELINVISTNIDLPNKSRLRKNYHALLRAIERRNFDFDKLKTEALSRINHNAS